MTVSERERAILHALLDAHELGRVATTRQLGRALSFSRTAVSKHLSALERMGLVRHEGTFKTGFSVAGGLVRSDKLAILLVPVAGEWSREEREGSRDET
jgi:hypothetical protein